MKHSGMILGLTRPAVPMTSPGMPRVRHLPLPPGPTGNIPQENLYYRTSKCSPLHPWHPAKLSLKAFPQGLFLAGRWPSRWALGGCRKTRRGKEDPFPESWGSLAQCLPVVSQRVHQAAMHLHSHPHNKAWRRHSSSPSLLSRLLGPQEDVNQDRVSINWKKKI